jgi:predicted metal-binding protein
MKLTISNTKEERDKLLKAIAQQNSEGIIEQFAVLLSQRDKFYVVAKTLCSHVCQGDEKKSEALFITLLNQLAELAEKSEGIDLFQGLSKKEEGNDGGIPN